MVLATREKASSVIRRDPFAPRTKFSARGHRRVGFRDIPLFEDGDIATQKRHVRGSSEPGSYHESPPDTGHHIKSGSIGRVEPQTKEDNIVGAVAAAVIVAGWLFIGGSWLTSGNSGNHHERVLVRNPEYSQQQVTNSYQPPSTVMTLEDVKQRLKEGAVIMTVGDALRLFGDQITVFSWDRNPDAEFHTWGWTQRPDEKQEDLKFLEDSKKAGYPSGINYLSRRIDPNIFVIVMDRNFQGSFVEAAKKISARISPPRHVLILEVPSN
jgi:hypothetical protein